MRGNEHIVSPIFSPTVSHFENKETVEESDGEHALAMAASLTFLECAHGILILQFGDSPVKKNQGHLIVQSVFWRFVFLENNERIRRETSLLSMGTLAVWF